MPKSKTPTFDLCMVCMKTAKFYFVSRTENVGHVTLLLERTKIVTFSTRHARHILYSLNNTLSIEIRECVEIVKFARQFGKTLTQEISNRILFILVCSLVLFSTWFITCCEK